MNTLINNDPCILVSGNKITVYDITFNKKTLQLTSKKPLHNHLHCKFHNLLFFKMALIGRVYVSSYRC